MTNKPVRKEGLQIKDLRAALKDLEWMFKGADKKGRLFLIDGNNSPGEAGVIPVAGGGTFRMRYREVCGNWLLCAVLSFALGEDYTFQDDPEGDGVLVNRTTSTGFLVEHVSAMDYPKGRTLPVGDDRAIWAVQKKIQKSKKNSGYAEGKILLVFMDGAGKWWPNKVGRAIAETHDFLHVFCVALLNAEGGIYKYSVSQLVKDHSPTFVVEINQGFTDYKVYQVQ